jgi:ribosomal protein L29
MNYSKEIVPLSENELVLHLGNLKKEYMNLRFQKKLDAINPATIRRVKRDIARVKTRLAEIKRNENKVK